jgi:hypothetical protein
MANHLRAELVLDALNMALYRTAVLLSRSDPPLRQRKPIHIAREFGKRLKEAEVFYLQWDQWETPTTTLWQRASRLDAQA